MSLKEVDPSSFDSCDGRRPNGQIIEQMVTDAAGMPGSPAANFRAEGLHVRHAADHNPGAASGDSKQCWQTAGITSDPRAILPSSGLLSDRVHVEHCACVRYAHNTVCALATSHGRLLRSTMHYRGISSNWSWAEADRAGMKRRNGGSKAAFAHGTGGSDTA